MPHNTYIAIDLKSFYASVECVDRGLDPLTTYLVVADAARTDKTVCLAVSPALKAHGVAGRARLFEALQAVREINRTRRLQTDGEPFVGSSSDALELARQPRLSLDCLVAQPRMARYMEASGQVYRIYLQYVAPEDIYAYSVDEVFIDATHYLKHAGLTAYEFALRMIRDVQRQTGLTATAGIGENLFLAKVAMDICAKHMPADVCGARIAELTEQSFRRTLWAHRPLTDFWRVGKGTADRLGKYGMYTMGDIARCSIGNEDLLYRLFGVQAELLIDHAWGIEPCRMRDIKAYRPMTSGLSRGQVLCTPYAFDKARLIVREMADKLALDLAARGKVCEQLVLTVGYDVGNLQRVDAVYDGATARDRYGRVVPKDTHGSLQLPRRSRASDRLMEGFTSIFERVADRRLLIRRVTLGVNGLHVGEEAETVAFDGQISFSMDFEAMQRALQAQCAAAERERRRQDAVLSIQRKYGKAAIFRAMSLEEGATGLERSRMLGGHRA